MTNDTVVIHKYKVIEKIGAGGFSTVYKAQHINNGKMVALKIVKLTEYAKIICNESKIISYLNRELSVFDQQFFPTLHWYGKFGNMTCLATTYYPSSLQNVLSATLDIKQKINIGLQMISLVRCIHELFIVHCDIKPDNFMINDDGKLVLIDFGLARCYYDFNKKEHVPNIKSHGIVGTFTYMSDYVKQGNRASRRDDVISVCKIMEKMDVKVKQIVCEYADVPEYDVIEEQEN